MIDPSILLQSRPVDTWTSATQAQNLQNMGTQNQLQQQQLAQTKALAPGALTLQQGAITGQGQENQQRAIDLKNQADTNAAIQKNIVTDPASGKVSINHDGVVSTLAQGGNAVAGMKYQQNANAFQKGINELQESNDKLQTDHTDHIASVASTILDAPPAVRASLYPIAVAGAIKNGLIKPGDLPAQYDPSIDPILTQARQASDKQRGVDAATTTAKSKADEDARKANQEYSGMIADAYGGVTDQASLDGANKLLAQKIPAAQLNQLVTQYGPQVATVANSTLTAKDRAANDIAQQTRDQAAAALKNTQGYQAAELGVRRQEVGISQARLELAQKTSDGTDPLAGRSPADIQRLTAIANGTAPALNPRSKDYKADMDAVYTLDPTYKESRYLGQKAFTTGKDSDNLVTLTTALAHLDRAKTNSGALGTSVLESLGANLTPAQHHYAADTDLLSGEIGKLVKNGAVSDTEANRLIGNMHSGLQSNRDAALDELSQLMNGKIEGVSQKYFNATGRAIPRSMYSPATQALMAKYNVGAASDAAATPTPGAPAPQPVAAPPAPAGSAVTQVPLPHVQALRNKYGYAPSN